MKSERIIDKRTKEGNNSVWQPTLSLRWKRYELDKMRYGLALQQLWKSNKGKEEWRDVPNED